MSNAFETKVFAEARVVVSRPADVVQGSLQLLRSDGTAVERDVSATDCEEVVEALALMTALAIEYEQVTRREKLPRDAAPKEKRRSGGVQKARFSLRPSTGVQLTAMNGITGEPTWSLQSFFELTERSSLAFRPSARATLKFGVPARIGGAGPGGRTDEETRIQWTSGALDICPIGFAITRWAELRPCAEGNVGFVKAAGPEGGRPRTASRLWAHVAGLSRARFGSIPLKGESPGVFIEIEAGVVLPLSRYAATLGGETLYTVPAAAFSGGISFGATL